MTHQSVSLEQTLTPKFLARETPLSFDEYTLKLSDSYFFGGIAGAVFHDYDPISIPGVVQLFKTRKGLLYYFFFVMGRDYD